MLRRAHLIISILLLSPCLAHAAPPGQLRYVSETTLPKNNATKGLRVYLPASYAAGSKRYPVLYVKNVAALFGTDNSGTGLEAIATRLAAEGADVIIIGLDQPALATSPSRENPLTDLVQVIKPWVDQHYRTLPDARTTGLAGGGLSGVLSVHAGLTYPNVFGFIGALSPDVATAERAVLTRAWRSKPTGQAFFISVGTNEGDSNDTSIARIMDASELAWALRMNGARVGYVEAPGAAATSSAWKSTFPQVLRSFQLFAKN